LFLKKGHWKIWSAKKVSAPPQTRRQVSTYIVCEAESLTSAQLSSSFHLSLFEQQCVMFCFRPIRLLSLHTL